MVIIMMAIGKKTLHKERELLALVVYFMTDSFILDRSMGLVKKQMLMVIR
jgi:hypothetical protein